MKMKEKKLKLIITFDLYSDLILPMKQVKEIGEELKRFILFEEKLEPNAEITFVNAEKLRGYNIVNNIRKEDEIIIVRGSVLTYEINKNEIENDSKILEELKEIEEKGLGLRRNEGFGRIKICSERYNEECN